MLSDPKSYSIRKKNLILGVTGPRWKEPRYVNKPADEPSEKEFPYVPPECLF